MVSIICERCKCVFNQIPSKLRESGKNFCSKPCFWAYKRTHLSISSQNKRNQAVKKVINGVICNESKYCFY